MAARIVAHIMARTPNLAMCAASCSPSSVRWVQVQPLQPLQPLLPLLPLRPLHPLQLQPRHRRGPSALGRASSASIQSRLSEVAVVVGPCTPNFRRLRRGRSRPRRPLFLKKKFFLKVQSLVLIYTPNKLAALRIVIFFGQHLSRDY